MRPSTNLEQLCAGDIDFAVDKALHTANKTKYHERYPAGRCPLCSLMENLVGDKVNAAVKRLVERLDLSGAGTYHEPGE